MYIRYHYTIPGIFSTLQFVFVVFNIKVPSYKSSYGTDALLFEVRDAIKGFVP